VAVPVIVLVVFAALVASSSASLVVDGSALARIKLPLGGASVERLSVIGGREQKVIPVNVENHLIWPDGLIRSGESVTVEAVIKRPGWISWLAGSTERIRLTLKAPVAHLTSQYLTVPSGTPLRVAFRDPVKVVEYGNVGAALGRHLLTNAQTTYDIPITGQAGSVNVAAAPRTWESPRPVLVSWFPPGSSAQAVADPAPGTSITSTTKITLSFSRPVSQVLGSHMPPVSPDTEGTWHQISSHAIRFIPEGYGYGLGASVSVSLPSSVHLVGGENTGSDPLGKWTVPAGSTLRLQELLAMAGYLPFKFSYSGAGVKPTLSAEVDAAVDPPKGTFAWSYDNVPAALRSDWSPGGYGVMTRGAVMAFENNEDMEPDGVAGPAVWKALINSVLKGQKSTFGYTFVQVNEADSGESESTWHDGKTVVSGPVNTGVAAAPTALGTYPVFEHLTVTTMSGINPDGSHYDDPGIPWVSYFNGGDALHGFIRASYGFPQSDGCVEMPYSEAGQVWPYTPVGTLVDVS
jgi:hypothetical protein